MASNSSSCPGGTTNSPQDGSEECFQGRTERKEVEENCSALWGGKGDGEDAGPETQEADNTCKDDTNAGRQEVARPSVKDSDVGGTLSESEDGEEETSAVAMPRGGETVPRPSHTPEEAWLHKVQSYFRRGTGLGELNGGAQVGKREGKMGAGLQHLNEEWSMMAMHAGQP
ncbi:hypothetical protein NDU88_001600 [Pleurodeles waltl]|uniref:Uncharacterized protein n=1 Tax=Pleurodeles waltl TaxID=8319 RepID=A0AAV7MKZ0_PLEWA|nr:hypothetical protein NDU88_001600 [Pleurodeles waltl]